MQYSTAQYSTVQGWDTSPPHLHSKPIIAFKLLSIGWHWWQVHFGSQWHGVDYIIQYSAALYCTVLYHTVLYCTVLYNILLLDHFECILTYLLSTPEWIHSDQEWIHSNMVWIHSKSMHVFHLISFRTA